MHFQAGYEFVYSCPQPTPMILLLNVHYSRASDLVIPDHMVTEPFVEIHGYRDSFGNWCNRIVAPAGTLTLRADFNIHDSGQPDQMPFLATQSAVEDLPEETLMFLLGSRYCETDILSDTAWQLFGSIAPGYSRVQAICDYVHNQIAFDYQNARCTRTAAQALHDRTGVCRDYAHLAVTLCRCMNIPARYCTGYLSDMGTAPPFGVGDFAAWFEVYIGGGWHTFDARNNVPRIGRILMARGRDAADVAMVTSFGPNYLGKFRVWTNEIPA